MNSMIVLLVAPSILSHLVVFVKSKIRSDQEYFAMVDEVIVCLFGDCGILSHEKKVVKLFSASFPKYYFLIQQIFAPFVQDKKLFMPGLPFQAELLRSGEVFIQRFIMGSDPIAQRT